MINLLIKQLFRSKGLIIGLVVLFVAGVLSTHIGKVFVDRQEQIIQLTEEAQQEHIERHVEYIDGHIGLLLYYIRFGFANDRSAITGLSIGNRDIRQSAQLVNIRNLEEQKNTSEFINPFFQLLGNLDFSFVLIYLFPLIIIALCFNIRSEENESGRWPLLSVQSKAPKQFIFSKLLLRWVLVIIVFFLLMAFSILYMEIPINSSLIGFISISFFYISFWFIFSWFVISWDQSSKLNAIILLSFWMLLNIILPAFTNSVVSYIYPIPEAYETTIDSREGYHTKWDQDKIPTIEKFKKHYPQYEKYSHPEDANFSWFWYYAMQQMGDDESLDARLAMKDKLRKRNQFVNNVGLFVPSIYTQISLNKLCKTDMENTLKFMDALERFHEEKRLYFYPKIFDDIPIANEDWSTFKMEYFKDQREVEWLTLLPMIITCFIFYLLATLNFNRIPKN